MILGGQLKLGYLIYDFWRGVWKPGNPPKSAPGSRNYKDLHVVILTKGRHFRMGKKFSDFKLLTLELFKLYHQSLKLKFLKYAAQVTTDFDPISAQSLCPNINVTFVMVVQKYLINRYFFSKYKNPIYFFWSQQLIRKVDLFHQFFEQEIVRKLFTIVVKIAYLVLQ